MEAGGLQVGAEGILRAEGWCEHGSVARCTKHFMYGIRWYRYVYLHWGGFRGKNKAVSETPNFCEPETTPKPNF